MSERSENMFKEVIRTEKKEKTNEGIREDKKRV